MLDLWFGTMITNIHEINKTIKDIINDLIFISLLEIRKDMKRKCDIYVLISTFFYTKLFRPLLNLANNLFTSCFFGSQLETYCISIFSLDVY
jgi:hypothetical protein